MATKKKTQRKTQNKKTVKKAAKKKAAKRTGKSKVAGEFSSHSPEAKAIYRRRAYVNNRESILEYQRKKDAEQAEKERKEFINKIRKKYNIKA